MKNNLLFFVGAISVLVPAYPHESSITRSQPMKKDASNMEHLGDVVRCQTTHYNASMFGKRLPCTRDVQLFKIENVPIELWPYLHEVLMFGNCLDNWCTSREAIKKIYEDTIPKLIKDGGAVVLESISANQKADKWNKDALSQVINTCGDTPVFFTNTSRVEDPGWIVTSREGEGWSMKLIRSLDQEQQHEIYSVDDIYAKVLLEYPDIGYVDPNTTLNQ